MSARYLAFALVGLVACHRSPGSDADASSSVSVADEQLDAAVQEAARVHDEALDKWKAKTRKACGLKADAEIHAATVRELTKMCIVLVDEGLKVPGSGEYPPLPSEQETHGMNSADGCRYSLDSYVDAKNALGVKVRTRFRCTFDPTTGTVGYKTL